jgi:Family of unknown function (DUF6062)
MALGDPQQWRQIERILITSYNSRRRNSFRRCLDRVHTVDGMDTKPAAYYDLLRVMTVDDPQDDTPRACPVCKLVQKGMLLYLDNLIYSCGVDPTVRKQIRLARGLCNRHAHLFTEVTGLALGVALIHLDVVDTINDALKPVGTSEREGTSSGGKTGFPFMRASLRGQRTRLIEALKAQSPCMGCEQQLAIEKIYLNVLLHNLDDGLLQAAFRASPGLCLPHYRQAVELAPDRGRLRLLTEIEHACLARLCVELRELTRKYDHRFTHETVGPEGDSWLRSIDQVTGRRGIR